MSEHNIVARPYAKAAFEFAVANQQLDAWAKQLQILAVLASDEQVIKLVKAPQVSDNSIAEALIDLCQKVDAGSFSQGIKNCILVLAENRRLLLLPSIAALFEKFRAKHEQFVDVDVTSCYPLDDSQKQALQKALETRFAKKVMLHFSEDEKLLGGVIIKAGDTVIDGSVRGKLSRLVNHLNLKEEIWQ